MKIKYMKYFVAALSVAVAGFAGVSAANPVANAAAMVVSGNARFTVLTPEMIRIEYSEKGLFEDRATFTVVNRDLPVPGFETEQDDEYVYITTSAVKLKYRKGTSPLTLPASPLNLSVTMNHNGQEVLWYPGKPDPQNLKGTCRTLDGANGDNKRSELENGLISRSGWAVIDDSWTASRPDGSRSFALDDNADLGYQWWAERKDPHAIDMYFLGYGKNYKKALSDFTKIAGKIPLPPDYVFGYWYSKYDSYSSDDYRNIMAELENHDIPADVMILDMDWHWNGDAGSMSGGRGGWTGWSWNTNLIPDPEGLLAEIHSHDLKVALNLHPAEGVNNHESPEYFAAMNRDLGGKYDKTESWGKVIPWMLDYPDFTSAFFKHLIHDHEREGVDFWWLDWQQHLTSPYTNGLGQTFWCNHVFFNDMVKNRPDRRPVIFHRWGGLGSHRYQIGFSGDALINFETLNFEPYFTATASNVGYAYWGHDLGGHAFTDEATVNNPELLLRWLQFGVFTPIFRTHATKDSRIERQIWKFPNFEDMNQAVKLRYALFPYIYTAARATYDTGIGMCRPLYYEYPDAEEAYSYEGEYFFGPDILVAPITEPATNGTSTKRIWFPPGEWWSASTGELIEGPCELDMNFSATEIPYFYRCGSIVPLNPWNTKKVTSKSKELILNVIAGKDGSGLLYEDGGDNADYAQNYATTAFSQLNQPGKCTVNIAPREGNAGAGAPGARSYTMRIFNLPPTEFAVRINGIQHGEYEYSEGDKCLTVKVPEQNCSAPVSVEIEYTPAALSGVTTGNVRVYYDRTRDSVVALLGTTRHNVELSFYSLAGRRFFNKCYGDAACINEDISGMMPQLFLCELTSDELFFVNKIKK